MDVIRARLESIKEVQRMARRELVIRDDTDIGVSVALQGGEWAAAALDIALEALDEYARSTWPDADTVLAQAAIKQIAATIAGKGRED